MKIEKSLSRHLTSIRGISEELARDTFIAIEHLYKIATSYANGEGDLDDAEFWTRATIRSFMSQVEGISFGMRNAVLDMAEDVGIELTNRTRAELSELKYDKTSDTIVQELSSKGPKETLKLAFRYFPSLFGSNWKLDTNDLGWSDFLRSLQMRNRVAHPTKIEYLYPVQAIPYLIPSIFWFHSTILDVFESCSSSLGASAPRSRVAVDLTSFRNMSFPSIEPDSELYRRIEDFGSNSLAYVNEVFRMVHVDVTGALDLLTESMRQSRTLTPRTAFACRNAVRSLFAGLEGMTGAVVFFILAAEKRREIVLTEQEREQLTETKDECERAAISANLFSKFFGHALSVKTQGDSWRALKLARNFRDRLTHPRSLRELDVKPGTITTLVEALEWYTGEFFGTTKIDVERWAVLGSEIPIDEILPEDLSGTDIPSEDQAPE